MLAEACGTCTPDPGRTTSRTARTAAWPRTGTCRSTSTCRSSAGNVSRASSRVNDALCKDSGFTARRPRKTHARQATVTRRYAWLFSVLSFVTLASSCGGDKATAPTSLPPASATAISSTSVQARVGDILDGPFGVRVADKNGAVLAGISVGCQVVAGSGTLTKATATTGGDGVATCGLWTLGTAPGNQEISINVGSLTPVKYVASAVPRPASRLTVVRALSVQVSSGKPPAETPIVQLQDDFGNTVAAEGATVSVSTDPP